MNQSIKDIYNDVYHISNNILSNFIGLKYERNALNYIEHNILRTIDNIYPGLNFSVKLEFNQHSNSLNVKINANSKYFPIISLDNYNTHKFIDSTLKMNHELILKCQSCNMEILNSGKALDGDYSCNEFIIKNIIE